MNYLNLFLEVFMSQFVRTLFIVSLIVMSACSFGSAFASTDYLLGLEKYKKITPADLGPLSLSVKKFSSKSALDAHHEKLLEEATDPKTTPLHRYTYALLLEINHADNVTRAMAIIALQKLQRDPKLSASDRATISYMKNLIIYSAQNKPFEEKSASPVAITHEKIFNRSLVNEYGTKMKISTIDKETGQFSAEMITRQGKKVATIGYVHNDIISFTTDNFSYLGFVHPNKIKTWWLSSIRVSRKGGDQLNIGDSTWEPVK